MRRNLTATTQTLTIVLLSLAVSSAAYAHAHLKNAAPSVGSTVRSAPSEVALSFTEELEPRFSSIEVQDKTGQRVDTGRPRLAADDAKHFSIGLKPLPPGSYTVNWHATSVDTHKTEGTFEFTVAP